MMGHLDHPSSVWDIADNTNLSASRTLDGNSKNAISIPVIDSPDICRSDSGGQIVRTSRIAPQALTSRKGFLMNTTVSAASLATAKTTAPPSIPLAGAAGLTSFPDLVDRFLRVRGLAVAQMERDEAWSAKIDNLVVAATGLSLEQRRKIECFSPAWDDLRAIENKISAENPDPDADSEDGSSTAWNTINPELTAVAKAMLRRKPKSIADLVWQTEALLAADHELREANGEHPMLPWLFKNIRALGGPLSLEPNAQARRVG
jgi:hypothetical protein